MTSPRAGQPATAADLVDVDALLAAYHDRRPDPSIADQRVAFGTSGHRGASLASSFNEWHVLAITEAICRWRRDAGIDGPLYIGLDTHALSAPAGATALEVLAAHGVHAMRSTGDEVTPTPAISQAIVVHNRGRTAGLADGVVVTPSHNPPGDGGFKYNPPHGGPAGTDVTKWIEAEANRLLEASLDGVRRVPYAEADRAPTTHRHDFLARYVADLAHVVDLDAIRGARLKLGVDPLGGAGVHYWQRIAEVHGIDLDVVSEAVDPTFAFMTLDWDGKIRMDPSSRDAMQRLLSLKDRYDVAFACDTDHDRHGIVTRSGGLMTANRYLAVSIDHLFRHRPQWPARAGVGKTIVSSALIDRVAAALRRPLVEVPVGFKWFVDGLADGSLGFGGEESAGSAFLRRDGTTWTTDKDGIAAALLAAEMTAVAGRDPAEQCDALEAKLGKPFTTRVDAPASREQKATLAAMGAGDLGAATLAGEPVERVLTKAPANDAAIGGIKVIAASGWFAARPSGPEGIVKLYAESFDGEARLRRIVDDAQRMIAAASGAREA